MLPLLLASLAFAAPSDAHWAEVAAAADMPVAEVQELAASASKQDSILERMARPWEARPWHKYHPILLTEERLQQGLAFWEAHDALLTEAEATYGVPAEVIVAILGVETRYGQVMGSDAVLDALYTLGFYHSRRGSYFRKELGHFLRLAHEQGWMVTEPKGSYAGAMGMGQFMPSSYRQYAVDGDGDGRRDLFGSPADAIASVANYFVKHGWRRGEGVLFPATVDAEKAAGLVSKELKPSATWADLQAAGVHVSAALRPEDPARLYAFDTETGPEYRVGLTNFYVITRYNHSALYARAVYELSDQLRTARYPR